MSGTKRDVTRAVLVVALAGGLVLLCGAALRLLGSDDHGALSVGAALFLATPLARNLAVLVREQRRAPRLLAAGGTAALLAVYAWAAWTIFGQHR